MGKLQGFHIHPRPAPTVSEALLARFQAFQAANVRDAMSRTTATSALKTFHKRGGMLVRPGDIVIGDGDGLLAIAPEEAEDIAARVEAIQRVEADALAAIAEGRADRAWVVRTLKEKGVL